MQRSAAQQAGVFDGDVQGVDPGIDDGEVGVLIERVERQPQAEALGQRDFLFHRFIRVDFAIDVAGQRIFRQVFRHQVAAVGSGVNQHVVGRRGDAAVEHGLERLVAGFTGFKRQVVAKNNVAFLAPGEQCGDISQINQMLFVDLNQAQALGGKLRQLRFHQRGFAGATRASQQHVVGRAASDELARILRDALFLLVDAGQVCGFNRMRMRHRFKPAAVTALAPAVRRRPPVGRGRRGRQPGFEPRQHRLGAG